MKLHRIATLVFAFGVCAQGAMAQLEPQFPRDIHGLWWQPTDPGWATTVFDQQAAMSSALLTYDFDGNPTWFFAPRLDCYREGSPGLNAYCRGPMYRVTGPWFGETFRPDRVGVEAVGQWEGWFGTPLFGGVGPNVQRNLFLTYSIGALTVLPAGDQPMVVQTIDPEAPFLYLNTSQSGLWGNPAESGWGIGLFQQGNRLTATLFIHGRDRQPRWYVANMKAPDLIFDADRPYEGEVFETRGHPFGRITAEPFQVRRVGRASVKFGTTATGPASLKYSIDGVEVSKTIFRVP